MSHPKSLLTDESINALVRLRELLPGTTDRELIEAALVEFTERVEHVIIELPEHNKGEAVAA